MRIKDFCSLLLESWETNCKKSFIFHGKYSEKDIIMIILAGVLKEELLNYVEWSLILELPVSKVLSALIEINGRAGIHDTHTLGKGTYYGH